MQGYISSAFGSAAILGPLIGGFLANHVSWKAIFWVNIPLGIIAAVMLQIALKENIQKRPHRIDYVGAALMATATGVLMFALVHGESLSSAAMAGAIAACIGLSLALWAYERRISEPLLPFELYRNRIIAGGNAIGLANGVIMMSIVGFLPAYMCRHGPRRHVGRVAFRRICGKSHRAQDVLSHRGHDRRCNIGCRQSFADYASHRRDRGTAHHRGSPRRFWHGRDEYLLRYCDSG